MQHASKRAPGMERTKYPGIYRRGPSYVVVWRHRGRQHKQAYPTLAQARAAKGARQAGETEPQDRLTFAAYAKEWITTYTGRTGRGLSDSTRADYERSLRLYAIPVLGHLRLSELSPRDIRGLVRELEDRGQRPGSVRKNIAPVRAMLATAVEDGLITGNPCAVIRIASRRPDVPDEPERRRALTRLELQALLQAADPQWRLFLEFLAHSGLRIGEAAALTWEDLELTGAARLHVRRQIYRGVTKPPKSRYGIRDIPLAPGMAQALRERKLAAGAGPHDPVFPGPGGGHLDPANLRVRMLRPAARDAGLGRIGFHTLRHTCASLLFEHGKNAKQVQEWLGHHDPGFTLATYVHLLDKGLGDAGFLDVLTQSNGSPDAVPLWHEQSGPPARLADDAGLPQAFSVNDGRR